MKVVTKIFIHYTKYSWETEGVFSVYPYQFDDDATRTFVEEQAIELDVPDDYDPTAQQIAALEAQKVKAMADYNETVAKINESISKLQALEYTP